MDTHVDDGCEEAAVALRQGDVAAGQLGVAPDTQQVHLVHAGAPCTHGGVSTSGRHFASASDLLALTVALARILALKR